MVTRLLRTWLDAYFRDVIAAIRLEVRAAVREEWRELTAAADGTSEVPTEREPVTGAVNRFLNEEAPVLRANRLRERKRLSIHERRRQLEELDHQTAVMIQDKSRVRG